MQTRIVSLQLFEPAIELIQRPVINQYYFDISIPYTTQDAFETAFCLLKAGICQYIDRKLAAILLVQQRRNLASCAIGYSIYLNTGQNYEMGTMWIIFNTITSLLNLPFQSIGSILLSSSTRF